MRFVYAFLLLTLCSTHSRSQDLALLHAKVYVSPNSRQMIGATILIRNGKIVAVGRQLAVPPTIESLDCSGCVVFAGFWNTHVHFMEPKWTDASHLAATQLARDLQQMLTRSGFTTVVDTGSDTMNTVELRRRIESGEVPGPRIYTAGFPLFPSHAIPFYLSGLPPEFRNRLPQPETPAEAIASVQQNIAAGTDIVKLFTGSIVAPGQVVPMSAPIASAAVAEAHRHHQIVFTHSTNLEGTRVAMDSGVDVLAHAPEVTEGLDDRLLQNLVARRMAIIPTLKLFSGDADIAAIRSVVFRFHRLGGVLMFGTDTGFLTDYDMGEEYRQLSLAGLGFRQTLTMLTTAPAERLGVSDHEGRIAPGMDADLTILSVDPATGDPLAFTQVRYTIRAGRIIFHSR